MPKIEWENKNVIVTDTLSKHFLIHQQNKHSIFNAKNSQEICSRILDKQKIEMSIVHS